MQKQPAKADNTLFSQDSNSLLTVTAEFVMLNNPSMVSEGILKNNFFYIP